MDTFKGLGPLIASGPANRGRGRQLGPQDVHLNGTRSGPVKIQSLKILHFIEMNQTAVGHLGVVEAQRSELPQRPEVDQPGTGHGRAVERERPEGSETAEVDQACVRHFGRIQIERLETADSLEGGHAFVIEAGMLQVQMPQAREVPPRLQRAERGHSRRVGQRQ